MLAPALVYLLKRFNAVLAAWYAGYVFSIEKIKLINAQTNRARVSYHLVEVYSAHKLKPAFAGAPVRTGRYRRMQVAALALAGVVQAAGLAQRCRFAACRQLS